MFTAQVVGITSEVKLLLCEWNLEERLCLPLAFYELPFNFMLLSSKGEKHSVQELNTFAFILFISFFFFLHILAFTWLLNNQQWGKGSYFLNFQHTYI
ncbi:unnamed protein product [Vicia faba]|uniref:Uncharacterized protein n=1 Tax=Vicia faba TaxID=3906 RepID=A0AAV1BEG1_VICFA|nr:unnamed protein product [Vicia faba]